MTLPDIEDIVDFITSNYSNAKKIVEIGVGNLPSVAIPVKKRLASTTIIVVDIDGAKIREIEQEHPELVAMKDDVFRPEYAIYRGASLIYAIRPPPELIPAISNLSMTVNADVLIRPLSSEETGFNFSAKWKFVRHNKATLYWLKVSQ